MSAAGAMVLALGGGMRAAHADSGSAFQLVGRIPFGHMVQSKELYTMTVEPAMNRGYVVVQPEATLGAMVHVRVVDLAAMRAVTDVEGPSTNSLGQGWNHLPNSIADSARHRVLFVVNQPTPVPDGTCGTVTGYGLAWLDEASLKWSVLGLPCIPGTTDKLIPTGLTYDPGTNSAYVVGMDASDISPAPIRHFLLQVDATTGAVLSSLQLGCDSNGDQNYVWPIDFAGMGLYRGSVYAACNKSSSPVASAATNRNSYSVVTKVATGPGGKLGASYNEELEIGQTLGSIFDPGTGIAAVVSTDPAYDLGTYIFDSPSGLFRGFVPTSNDQSNTGTSQIRAVGLNAASGRLYMQTREGMVVSDVRNQPVPVGLSYADLADKASNGPGNPQMISVDSNRSRVVVPNFQSNVQAWDVYQDNTPPTAVATSQVDPDVSTTNVPEATGVTGTTYTGAAEAFGARLLSEGGVNRILESRLGACGPSWDSVPNPQAAAILDCPYSMLDSPGDREWYFGHAGQSSLTNLGASAKASAFDVADAATAKDFQNANMYGTTVNPPAAPGASPNSIPLPGLLGPYQGATPLPSPPSPPATAQFPADRAQDRPHCQDFGGASQTGSEAHSVGSASVVCDQNTGLVKGTGTAQAGGSAGAGAIPMTYSATTTVTRNAADGVTTEAKAEVNHVHLPPVPDPAVYIRKITTDAITKAHGRPGTASGSFTRHFYGFSSVGPPGSAMNYSCSDDDAKTACNPQKVADAITAAFANAGINAAAYVPSPDSRYLNGTPGGFQALVTKDSLQQASDHTVNDDNSDTAAGLSIIVYNDGIAGRSRQIIQFAGVHAESHYGIYLLSAPPSPFATSEATPDSGPLAVIPGGSGGSGTNNNHTPTGSGTKKPGGITGAIRHFADLIEQGWRLLVSDPATAAALAGLWALLVAPVYLAMRRRALVSRVAAAGGV